MLLFEVGRSESDWSWSEAQRQINHTQPDYEGDFPAPLIFSLVFLHRLCQQTMAAVSDSRQNDGFWVFVPTDSSSGFLWSCHPGLACEQLCSSIFLLNLSRCHQLVNVLFHCCRACSPCDSWHFTGVQSVVMWEVEAQFVSNWAKEQDTVRGVHDFSSAALFTAHLF